MSQIIPADEANLLATEANKPHTIESINARIESAATGGAFHCTLDGKRVNSGMEAVLLQKGYDCERVDGSYTVRWYTSEADRKTDKLPARDDG